MEHDTTRHDHSKLVAAADLHFFELHSNNPISGESGAKSSIRVIFAVAHIRTAPHAFTAIEVKNIRTYTEGDQHFYLSLFSLFCSNLSHCQTSMDFAIAQWTLHSVQQFHLLLQLKFASLQKCSITGFSHSVCRVRLCVWATMSDASMILTLEHYNNHVVRKTLPLFVHVSSSSAVDIASGRLGVCEFVCWKLFS